MLFWTRQELRDEIARLQSENILIREESDRHYQLWIDEKAVVERLRKAGDAMASQYFDLYWSLHAESTSRHEPKSITDWEAAKGVQS